MAAQRAIEREDLTIRRAVISTGSIAAASLVTGAVLGALGTRRQAANQQQAADRDQRRALFANVSFGLAALSAITSFTLFMTHKNKRKRERETARWHIETLGAGASATLRF